MNAATVPEPLRERLGDRGTTALLDVLETKGEGWRRDVLTMATERFEHRLSDECNRVRLEMTHGFAALRQEMVEGQAALRKEIAEGHSALRKELSDGQSLLRAEMHQGMASVRVEIIKWSFAFWLAQIVTLVALFSRAAG